MTPASWPPGWHQHPDQDHHQSSRDGELCPNNMKRKDGFSLASDRNLLFTQWRNQGSLILQPHLNSAFGCPGPYKNPPVEGLLLFHSYKFRTSYSETANLLRAHGSPAALGAPTPLPQAWLLATPIFSGGPQPFPFNQPLSQGGSLLPWSWRQYTPTDCW
jgi:hypothetical protein